MSWFDSWVWPKLDSRRRAQNAIEEGFWAATFVSGVSLLFLFVEVMKDPDQFEISSLFGIAVFALIALEFAEGRASPLLLASSSTFRIEFMFLFQSRLEAPFFQFSSPSHS